MSASRNKLSRGSGCPLGGRYSGSMSQAPSPFRYFHYSPEVIRLVVLMYVRFPLSLRNVEDLLNERGIDLCHQTVRLRWNRFGPLFAADIRRQRVSSMRGFRHWRSATAHPDHHHRRAALLPRSDARARQ